MHEAERNAAGMWAAMNSSRRSSVLARSSVVATCKEGRKHKGRGQPPTAVQCSTTPAKQYSGTVLTIRCSVVEPPPHLGGLTCSTALHHNAVQQYNRLASYLTNQLLLIR